MARAKTARQIAASRKNIKEAQIASARKRRGIGKKRGPSGKKRSTSGKKVKVVRRPVKLRMQAGY